MYLRFVSSTIYWASGVEAGIFIAAYELRDDASLPDYEYERLAGLLSWFDRHLREPARFSRGWRGGRRAVCWFRPTASLHISKAHELAALLREHGVPVRMIKTAKVGYVVYEDEHQIVAEPFADTGC